MPLLASSLHASKARATVVEVVFLLDDSLLSVTGRLIAHRAAHFEVEVDADPPHSAAELRVVLSVRGDSPRRILGRVVKVAGHRLTVEEHGSARDDKRRFPRLPGAIGLRWRHAHDGTLQERGWHEPDPYMSFSVGGFAFGAAGGAVQEGDLLTLDFSVGASETRYAGIGRVVRVAPRPRTEVSGTETHEVALELVDVPFEAREALAALTLLIQRALTHDR